MVAAPLSVTDSDRVELTRMASSTVLAHRVVVQAKALLWAAEGVANDEIGRRCGVDSDAVRRWRSRFAEQGVAGVGRIAKGRGRKPSLPPGTVAEVLRLTREELPADGSTHWSTRTLAARVGIGKDTVARIWADHGLKPWKVTTFKISNDPAFEDKLVDVVGLYLDPPARAAVFSFDEKTQCQALDRTQPSLPMKPGRAGTMTHDYKRNGTIDLFAALNVGTGEVLTELRHGHKGTDVLRFFKQIDASVPRDLDVHVILDNLSAHKTPEIAKWLAHKDRRRWHLHFTPTSSSWLNLVERWFKELTDKRLRRGVFTSVAELAEAIATWAEHWNRDPKPFVWKATADDIIAKVRRGRETLNQIKSQTDHEWITMIVFGCTALLWITRPLLVAVTIGGGADPWRPFAGLSDAGIAILAAMALFVIPAQRSTADERSTLTFTMNWTTATKLPWGILVLFGGGLSLAAAVKSNEVAEFLGVQAVGLRDFPPVVLVLAVTVGVIFLTELTSNTATTATLVPVLAGLALGLGVSPEMLIIPATIAASCAFMLPVATPPNAIVFGSGYITIPQMARAGFWLNIIGVVLITTMLYAVILPLLGSIA